MNIGKHICILIRTCTRTYAHAYTYTIISSRHLTLDIALYTLFCTLYIPYSALGPCHRAFFLACLDFSCVDVLLDFASLQFFLL